MLSNLSYTIPVAGRITIGDVIENERGKRLPIRLNHFRITSQYKCKGEWVPHPLQAAVAAQMGVKEDKLTEIPVKLMFNKPALTIRERLESYQDGRLTCAGCDKGKAKRLTREGMQTVECLGPEICEYALSAKQGCNLMARINLRIDAAAEGSRNDEFSSFILRTRGYNSAKTITAKLEYAAALFKNKLIGIPFILKLRKKSTPLSFNSPFYYADLVLGCSLLDAAKIGQETAEAFEKAGLDQAAFEEAVEAGLANGPFEDTVEEVLEVEELLLGADRPTEGESAESANVSTAVTQDVSQQFDDSVVAEEAARPYVDPTGLNALRQMIESKPDLVAA